MPLAIYPIDGGDLVIEFDYQPAESATDTYPGCPDSVTIGSVRAGPFEILEWCSKAAIRVFEEKCWESIQDAEDKNAES